ncbi:MAG: TonB C-terminal domain-containing protein [SAR324 cluster bacterium]|nr:TonB C-terminal domain-containing protein [SAR324 cluster bacterium]MBL7036124.1 TonB C-terminal domain-containing protein [SAR324 cluster bacterium]
MRFLKFFLKITKNPTVSAGFRTSAGNLFGLEKLLFTHDQSVFSLIFIGSLLLHVTLGLLIAAVTELWIPEPPPIRAKIGVRYAELPSKPSPIKQPKAEIIKPVLQKIDVESSPKLLKPLSQNPVLKKPFITESTKNSTLAKPDLSRIETPRLKMSTPKINNPITNIKQSKVAAPQVSKKPVRPILPPPNSPGVTTTVPSLPKLKIDPVPLSTLTSKKSKLSPSQPKLPSIPLTDLSKKIKAVPKFTQTQETTVQELPRTLTPAFEAKPEFTQTQETTIQELPRTLTPAFEAKPEFTEIQSVLETETTLEEIFPEDLKTVQPLQELSPPLQKDRPKLSELPDTSFLQRRKLTQLAGEEYNVHIRTRIIPKLGSYSAELFVRIQLEIEISGEIVNYKVIENSGSTAFDRAAELAVRNAILEPLPSALAENPPYIVLIKIVAPN